MRLSLPHDFSFFTPMLGALLGGVVIPGEPVQINVIIVLLFVRGGYGVDKRRAGWAQ